MAIVNTAVVNTQETHPWKWYVPNNARCLIVGTHPPTRRNWSFDFFYPNKRNFFWKIIAALTATDFVYNDGPLAVRERSAALDALGLGVTDMGYVIDRQGDSSLDENITVVEFMDIHAILDLYPTIDTLLLTSSSGRTSAKAWLQAYLKAQHLELKFAGKEKVSGYTLASGRVIKVAILPSPSPRYANHNRLAEIIEKYKFYISPPDLR